MKSVSHEATKTLTCKANMSSEYNFQTQLSQMEEKSGKIHTSPAVSGNWAQLWFYMYLNRMYAG